MKAMTETLDEIRKGQLLQDEHRYAIAKDLFVSIMQSQDRIRNACIEYGSVASAAVKMADLLIAELKKE